MEFKRYNHDEYFETYEREFNEAALEELFNEATTRFLNDWAGDQEDASDGPVFNALIY